MPVPARLLRVRTGSVGPCAGRAARFLEDFKVPPGEYLLSNAANSVLGRELIQMAQRRGTKLINVVRRREVVAELHKLGCAAGACKTGHI